MNESSQPDDDTIELDVQLDYRSFLMNYPVRVYFASPLTGLTESQQKRAEELREATRMTLDSSAEHYFDVYDPAKNTQPGSPHEPCEVYCIDHHRVEGSDVVFFFAIGPSTGMGMEAQIAAEATIPRVVIAPRGLNVTRMFLGAPSRTLATIEFDSPTDIAVQLAEELAHIGAAAAESRRRRDRASKQAFKGIGRRLLKRRILRGITLQELADQTDQTSDWLKQLEGDPATARPMSFPLFLRICDVLGIHADFDDDMETVSAKILDSKEMSATMRESLDSLVDFVVGRPTIDDQRVLRMWQKYRHDRELIESEAIVGREDLSVSLTIEDWKEQYESGWLF